MLLMRLIYYQLKFKKKKMLLRDLCVFSIRVLSELFLINGCSSVLEECIRV